MASSNSPSPQAAWTPGPWTAECESQEDNGPWAVFAGDRMIAQVEWWDNAHANARLIAAGPTMHEALEKIASLDKHSGASLRDRAAAEIARAAISKARR